MESIIPRGREGKEREKKQSNGNREMFSCYRCFPRREGKKKGTEKVQKKHMIRSQNTTFRIEHV